jgi:hypothetical protein
MQETILLILLKLNSPKRIKNADFVKTEICGEQKTLILLGFFMGTKPLITEFKHWLKLCSIFKKAVDAEPRDYKKG